MISQELGITLIPIPYWWDKTLPSLAATIHYYRPDIPLSQPMTEPIPFKPTTKRKISTKYEHNVAQALDAAINPTGWYSSLL
jgi:hypothetical protein